MLLQLLPPWILDFWHLYRTTIILYTFAILLVIRTIVHPQRSREVISTTRLEPALPASFSDEKISSNLPSEKQTNSTNSTGPRRVVGGLIKKSGSPRKPTSEGEQKIQVLVFFSSLAGSTEKYAQDVTTRLGSLEAIQGMAPNCAFLKPKLHDLSEVDYDDYFISPPKSAEEVPRTSYFYLFLLPTYNIDTVLDTFLEHLRDTHNDFRIDSAPLSSLLGYSVFGFGNREEWPTEEEGFCSQAREVDKWMAKLSAKKRAYPLGMGDCQSDAVERLSEWSNGIEEMLKVLASTGGLGEGVVGSGDPAESDVEDIDEDSGEVLFEASTEAKKIDTLGDLEDLGGVVQSTTTPSKQKSTSVPLAIDFTTYGKPAKAARPVQPAVKEMVPATSPTYAALTKQGYTIVGSHSGVKICRWTKSALRGRGSCYKYSFYGIASHQCMETTPSLSCSNKCVFCWRHGTNPVGTTWRWVVDPPDLIFAGVKAGHYRKIKMLRGVPGVRSERFSEALRIRHCALSLVGEPIFYPHINAFLALLHRERISSFLVCNAQHPEQLRALGKVTQLYVSIDASDRESLRRIDRPLHRDFWERFQACLAVLRARRREQRTVFRLTLVKGFNVEAEAEGYAALVEQALPCFVEVKGVTYCGTSSAAGAGLTMRNVPFYDEVCAFVRALDAALRRRGLAYGIAAEHAHSCCVLIASERFRRREDGRWCTRIDYDRFFELLESGREFAPEDYVGEPTPEWACWGNGGFDPRDERVYRKGKNKNVGVTPATENKAVVEEIGDII